MVANPWNMVGFLVTFTPTLGVLLIPGAFLMKPFADRAFAQMGTYRELAWGTLGLAVAVVYLALLVAFVGAPLVSVFGAWWGVPI